MIDKLYDRFKSDFAQFLVGMEKTFDEVWQEFLSEMTTKKAEIENKIETLENKKDNLDKENASLISVVNKLNDNKKKLTEIITAFEKKNKDISDELLLNTEKIEQLKKKEKELSAKEEELSLKEIGQRAKDESLREREARINSIFTKINS